MIKDKIGWLQKFCSDANIDKYFLLTHDNYVYTNKISISENYKVCLGYKDTKYIITDKGTIYHYIPQYNLLKEIKSWDCKGYRKTCFRTESGKSIQLFVHRVVAMLFIPNPENKDEVNHKNRNKQDNCVENLEWVTKSENELHKWNTQGGMKETTKKKISEANKGAKSYRAKRVECIETGEVWDTAKQASYDNGFSINRVSQACNSKRPIKGKHFRYI
jgi:hypothetical protein